MTSERTGTKQSEFLFNKPDFVLGNIHKPGKGFEEDYYNH
jgi:hypothetical protein